MADDSTPATVAIDDPADPRVADYVGLSDAAIRRRFEDPGGGGASPRGRFIVEGLLALEALLGSTYRVRSVLVSERQLPRVQPLLAAVDAPLLVATQAVLDTTVGFSIHRGIVASAERQALPDPIGLATATGVRRVAVLEGLNDHENLGVLFRNAAAFGIDAVLLDPRCADPLYRRCVRVSQGHALRVPFARFSEPRWPAGLHTLAEAGFDVLALTPSTRAMPLEELPRDAGRPVAFVVGAEGLGLSDAALAVATTRVCIAMQPGVDSLNVATAAAIAFHWCR